MRDILVRARRGRVFLLVAYDFTCWVVGFASMAAVQVAVGYSNAQNLGAATTAGVVCGLGFVLLGLPLHLHHGRAKIGSFYDAVLVVGTGGRGRRRHDGGERPRRVTDARLGHRDRPDAWPSS